MKLKVIQSVLLCTLALSLQACVGVELVQDPNSDQSGTKNSPIIVPTSISSTRLPLQTSTPAALKTDRKTPSLPSGVPYDEVAYISDRSGMAEVWLLDLVTGLERQLTETDCSDAPSGGRPDWYVPGVQGFSWSPDGRRIAYLATCNSSGGGSAHLGVIDLLTGETTLLTSDHLTIRNGSYPSWGLSDQFIFSQIESVYEPIECVQIADLGGEHPEVEPLPGVGWEEEQHQGYCPYWLTWSPNKKYIAYGGPYVGLPGTGSRAYVSIVDTEGNHLTYEPANPHSISEYPELRHPAWIVDPIRDGFAWSSNSRYLAVTSEKNYVLGSLLLIEVYDQVAVMRVGLYPDSFDSLGVGFYSPVFSPDDEILYFVSLDSDIEDPLPTERFGTIYSVSVQELLESGPPDLQVVSSLDQLAAYPSLSSDGKWLVYAVKVGETVEIWLQAVDGMYRQRLVGDGFANTRPAWRPR